jgi:L-ribulose-5-phosphate 4-epimerase
MSDDLREAVYEANLFLHRHGLAIGTFGNASGIDRERGLVLIKPSGLPYEQLRPEHLVSVDLHGRVVAGELRPSSDTRSHCALYRAWPDIGGVVHTHSTFATAWSQSRRDLPCYGTTHADYAPGAIPCAAPLSATAVEGDYEEATGAQIIARMRGTDPTHCGMILVGGHGPFTWGAEPMAAAHHAQVLEHLALMAAWTERLAPDIAELPAHIRDKHWQRKHGHHAYYGQL